MDVHSKIFDVFGDEFSELLDEAINDVKNQETETKDDFRAHGFSYPGIVDEESDHELADQMKKIEEELDEAKSAILLWATNNLRNTNAIGMKIIADVMYLSVALVELEDVIHAAEEMQKKLLKFDCYNETSFDDIKKTVMESVYMKNKDRGYYGEQ